MINQRTLWRGRLARASKNQTWKAILRPMSPTVFCSRCGQAIDAGERFCRHCGQPQPSAAPSASAAAPALGRFFAKYISSLTLGIGFIRAGFTERKQGLHDMIAGTLVVRSNEPPYPIVPPQNAPAT